MTRYLIRYPYGVTVETSLPDDEAARKTAWKDADIDPRYRPLSITANPHPHSGQGRAVGLTGEQS